MKQPVQRRLAAILAADVAGYSRLMGADEEGTHERLKAHLSQLVDPKIKEHRGRIVKNTGDGMLVEFSSVVDAVRCAAEVQRGMADRNAEIPEDKRITFRVGINLGDVIAEADDIYGDGVNVAARLEGLAEPGGICISRVVRDQVRDKLPYPFEDRGEQSVKNIARSVRVYALRPEAVVELPATGVPTPVPRRRIPLVATVIATSAVLVIGAVTWRVSSMKAPPSPLPPIAGVASENASATAPLSPVASAPRLSIVVLPIDNFGDRPEDARLADSLTDDITTRLAQISSAFVVARTTAFSFKGSPLGAHEIAVKLGVRYVVEGSLYRLGDTIRFNAQLIDAAAGAHVWASQFDANAQDAGQRQRDLMGHLVRPLRVAVLDAEARRLERQPPGSLSAADLLLQVEADRNHAPTLEQDAMDAERLEKALQLEPRSVEAMLTLSDVLLRPLLQIERDESAPVRVRRARQLIEQARDIAPGTRPVLTHQALLLRVEGRWDEAEAAYRHLLDRYPDDFGLNNQVAVCDIALGRSEEALPLLRKAISLSLDEPQGYISLANLGRALVLLGRDGEAVEWLRRAKQEAPVVPVGVHRHLAAAYAHLGRMADARMELTAFTAKMPWVTLRWLRHGRLPTDAAVAERVRELDGLEKSGLRDHADEEADIGIDPQLGLRSHAYLSPTPSGAPGVTTITTIALAALLERDSGSGRPLILGTTRPKPDFRIPGSVEVPGVFVGDFFDADAQHAFAQKITQLTGGNKSHPIVAAGWNSERWSGRNLALQLVALGYQNVYWYRGGLEAWDVAGLPEEPAASDDLTVGSVDNQK
jgi:class 3 adenylate cyclase/TolB-like protein/Flp pilus assembly protein TadD/rhodanese-related sulfurtransferase